MKKHILLMSPLLMIFLLAACSSTVQEPINQTAENEVASEEVVSNEVTNDPSLSDEQPQNLRAMPSVIQFALGTFKLEETEYPVDSEQAVKLLPLWKAARSLSESETTAAAEVEAVVKQIRNTFTKDQLETISSMELSFQDMRAILQKLGIEFSGFGGRFEDLDPEMRATIQAARESGQGPGGGGFGGGQGFPGGGGPGGFPGGGPGGGLSPEQRETAIARRGGRRGATFGLNPVLIDAIIEFLDAKAQ